MTFTCLRISHVTSHVTFVSDVSKVITSCKTMRVLAIMGQLSDLSLLI